ncbi:MAG: DUF3267 domain-containing protein [Chloroflexi bacterium]|nr:DUF3267 domain-containing protein [Chloroflexota bacterium]
MGIALVAALRQLPPDYREAAHFTASDPKILLRLNLLALIPMLLAYFGLMGWQAWLRTQRAPISGGSEWLDALGLLFALVGVLLLHEGFHGVAINAFGFPVRYGAKYADFGRFKLPIFLYATTDGGYFRRGQFIIIALAPLLGITLLCLLASVVLPERLGLYIALTAAVNAGGAIGDLWMTWLALRYPPTALIKDEADSIRIYTQGAAF